LPVSALPAPAGRARASLNYLVKKRKTHIKHIKNIKKPIQLINLKAKTF
jgi:hypothetical protein